MSKLRVSRIYPLKTLSGSADMPGIEHISKKIHANVGYTLTFTFQYSMTSNSFLFSSLEKRSTGSLQYSSNSSLCASVDAPHKNSEMSSDLGAFVTFLAAIDSATWISSSSCLY